MLHCLMLHWFNVLLFDFKWFNVALFNVSLFTVPLLNSASFLVKVIFKGVSFYDKGRPSKAAENWIAQNNSGIMFFLITSIRLRTWDIQWPIIASGNFQQYFYAIESLYLKYYNILLGQYFRKRDEDWTFNVFKINCKNNFDTILKNN